MSAHQEDRRKCPTALPATAGHAQAPLARFFLRGPALAFLALSLLTGCGAHRRAQPGPAATEDLALLRPAIGDTVAGEVVLEAAVRTSALPGRLIFRVGDSVVDTLLSPPWMGHWSADAPQGGAWREILVEAERLTQPEGSWEAICRSPPVRVWVWPDSAPKLTLALPSAAKCFERRSGMVIQATAIDPEDGPLASSSVHWAGSRMGRTYAGAELPIECLPDGWQTLTAEAVDRWGRAGQRTVSLCPFRYRSGAEPGDCLENLAYGLQSMDLEACRSQLDSAFVFLPCPLQAAGAGWERIWRRAGFERLLEGWLASAAGGEIMLSWSLSRASSWTNGGSGWAWIPLNGIGLRCLAPGETVPAEASGSTDGSAAALLVRRPGGVWRLRQWEDVPPSKGAGLAELLATGGGWARPTPGSGCRRP